MQYNISSYLAGTDRHAGPNIHLANLWTITFYNSFLIDQALTMDDRFLFHSF
jgi:hypothetical protein